MSLACPIDEATSAPGEGPQAGCVQPINLYRCRHNLEVLGLSSSLQCAVHPTLTSVAFLPFPHLRVRNYTDRSLCLQNREADCFRVQLGDQGSVSAGLLVRKTSTPVSVDLMQIPIAQLCRIGKVIDTLPFSRQR